MMASVVTCINELGVEVQHIPGGCTGLCQPVDVGVAKPLKDKLKDQWELWMIEEVAGQNGALPQREWIDRGTTIPPKREQIAEWTIAALEDVSTQTVKNAWRHRDFGWFPEDMGEAQASIKTLMIRSCLSYLVCHSWR